MAGSATLVAVEGPSAAGKTTLVRTAARRFGWVVLPEAFDRLDPAPSLEFDSPEHLLLLEETLLAEEARRYGEARQRCAVGRTVLADTGFLGPVTYTRGLVALGRSPPSVARSLERSARALLRNGGLGIPDLTVYLATSDRERARRAERDRPRHPEGLFARHETVGALERRLFESRFPRALPSRFRTLSADPSPAALSVALRRLVADAPSTPAVQWEGLQLLRALGPVAAPRRGRNAGPNR